MDMQGLSSICAGLGGIEEDEKGNRIGYSKGAYCLDNLKDLLRFLRRDDPQSREVFKQVCKWNIVSRDLIPIIEHCQGDRHLVLNAVKVLVFLTMPVEPTSSDIPQQIEYLWGLKSAITSSDTVAVIVSLLETSLENLESDAFTEDDWKLMQLILTLFRNLLSVQEISAYQKAAGFSLQILSLRDRFLELLFQENVMDIILVATQHVDSSGFLYQDNFLLLEIFYYTFNGQDPELIAKAHLKDLKEISSKTSITSLKSIIEEEKDKRRLLRHQIFGHHSHFSGTFARFTMDGSKEIFKGSPKSAPADLMMKPEKISRGSKKKILWDYGKVPSLKEDILKLLHDFVTQFLAGGYNVLMQSIREDVEKEHHNIQKIDVLHFFEVAKFVMAFQYQKQLMSESIAEADNSVSCSNNNEDNTQFKGELCGPIAATMNESMFVMVISKWRDAFDGLKQTNNYQFLSAAGSLMKVMIRALNLVLKLLPEDSRESQTARILLYKLFYDQTDQGMTQFILSLMKSFDAHKQPRSDLADLVEVMCTTVRLMERLQDRGAVRVSKKSRKGRKKKVVDEKVESTKESPPNGSTNQEENEPSNKEQSARGDAVFQGGQTPAGLTGEARSEQLDADKLHNTDTSAIGKSNTETNLTSLEKSDHPNNESDSSSDSSSDEQMVAYNEVDFKLSNLLSAFANGSIIQNICWLLRFYKSNSASTNKYIISMLRTVSDDLELAPMLYQLSLLTTFYEILSEQKSSPHEEYSDITNFLTRLIRNMLRKMKHQPLLFVDILFWKTRRECHHINADYLLHEVDNLKKGNRYVGAGSSKGKLDTMPSTGWVRRSIADALGEDEADVVLTHGPHPQNNEELPEMTSIPDRELDRMVNLGGDRSSTEGKDGIGTKRRQRLVLSHELETKIRDLYDKFKNEDDCYQRISEALDPDGKVSQAQILNKLKRLGLEIPRKKRKHSDVISSSCQNQPAEGDADERESASLRKPLHTRKRVHALNKDEEAKIKQLFEKFKNHRRCSYMIANAMAGDRNFTAAQVTRQLKQLGLKVSRLKRHEVEMNLAEEYPGQSSLLEFQDSDNETLLAMRLKTKHKRKAVSENELQCPTVHGKLFDNSDDEILGSALKSRRKHFSKSMVKKPNIEKLTTSSTEGNLSARISDDKIVKDAAERDAQDQPCDTEDVVNPVNMGGTSEVEEMSNIDPKISATRETSDPPSWHSEDLLEDSDCDVASDAFVRRAVDGRKSRVVFDLDDDGF